MKVILNQLMRRTKLERNKRIYGNELKYLEEVLKSEFRSSEGSTMMTRLEKAFAEKLKHKYAISFINGTQTMHAVLEAIGVGPGDEVIVPPLTMASTTFPVLQAGATPVFADVDMNTFLIDPHSIEKNITERTKAIIPVSLYGLAPDYDAIMKIADKNNLFVLEDNAECILGKYKGRMVGSFGQASSYSFQSSKHITSGEGGMIVTDDLELAEKIRRVSSLGYAGVGADKGKISKKDIQSPDYCRHVSLGWNYRMPELCAAVALAQLEKVEELVQKRVNVAKLFLKVLESCDWLTPQYVPEGIEHTYWTLVVKNDRPDISWYDFRDKFMEYGGDGIYSAWQLTYLEPMFQKMAFLGREKELTRKCYDKGLCPNAESLQPRLLQFKTNYWNFEDAKKQADYLEKAIKFFSK